jgi:hypothetical protein
MTAMKCFMVLPLLTGEDLCGHRSLLCSSAAVQTIPSNHFRMKRTVANALGVCLEKTSFLSLVLKRNLKPSLTFVVIVTF